MKLTEWGRISFDYKLKDRSKIWNAVLDTIIDNQKFKNALIELVNDKAPAVMTLLMLQRRTIELTKEDKITALLKNRYNVADITTLNEIEKVLK